jgi:hypothetical protein
MDGISLAPYVMTKAFVVGDGQDLITSEGYDFNIDTPITIPGTNVHVLLTHPVMANTTINSSETSFSELATPGYSDGPSVWYISDMQQTYQQQHSDRPSVCNIAGIQHMQQTYQQQHSDRPRVRNIAGIQHMQQTYQQQHSDRPSVRNTADIQHEQQTHQQQQTVVWPAEHDRQTVSPRPTSLTLPSKRKMASKIPRPPNAFILFGNEWRKKLALQHPGENNKEISVRLGAMWKSMTNEEKGVYMALAREADAKHKKKYPDYVYNPQVARIQKSLRESGLYTTTYGRRAR